MESDGQVAALHKRGRTMRRGRLLLVCMSLIILPLMLTSISSAEIDPESIAGYWKFDEGSGDMAKDSSGKGNDGELVKGNGLAKPEWTEGRFRTALKFDGWGGHVDCGDDPSTFITEGPLTLAAWIKPTGSGRRAVINRGDKYTLEVGFPGGDLLALYYLGSWKDSGHEIPDDVWTHAAAVFEGANTFFYVDGDNVSTVPTAGVAVAHFCNLLIGDQCGTSWFNGVIDEVVISNAAFGVEDVKVTMNGGLSAILGVSSAGKLATTWGEIKVPG